MMNDQEIEQEIQSKGLDAPRLTPYQIENTIEHQEFHVHHGRLTICILVLRNGFIVTDESSCVSQANFDKELGEKISRKNAVDKIWMLEGYSLRTRLFGEGGY
jgi:hypothetical protein